MLSFSTCWNSSRHTSGRDVAQEIMDLGFQRIELSHGLRAPMVADLLAAKEELGFEVSSLHCFCPLPPEVLADNPDCYEFTSDKPESRRRAVKMALQTIDMAARFGAPCVVVHAGRIRSLSATRHLRELAAAGGILEKEYARAKLEAVRQREAAGPAHLKRSLEAVQQLAAHAAERGVRLGIENRDDYEAVPSEREVDELLRKLNASNVGYWHDFGHAHIKHNLGLLDHRQWLREIGDRAIGCHIHDVQWPFSDHQAPFTGEVPYTDLVPGLPPDIEHVFEISPAVGADDIRKAAARWRELFEHS